MNFDIKSEYDKIYRYCYFKLGNPETAEDITQEAFLKFFSQASYQDQGKPSAYLHTIAKNLCIDYFRKAKPEPLDENAIAAELNMETSISLRCAVNSLSDELRELVLLLYANELGINEIAAVTSQSRFAVRRKIAKALSELKKSLGKEFF